MTTLGFYGKLASRGDFVSRALPQSFVGPWDSWLAAGLLARTAWAVIGSTFTWSVRFGVLYWRRACAGRMRRRVW